MKFGEYCKTLDHLSPELLRDVKWLGCEYLNCNLYDLNVMVVDDVTQKKLNLAITKLKNGEPLAYITNSAPFFGEKFYVDKNVLIPRMETELLLEWVIKDNKSKHDLKILDMCTGSGCIAIILKKYLNCTITAVDCDNNALKIAQKNAKRHNVNINFVQSNMFDKLSGQYDIIVCNPPYIPSKAIKKLDNNVKDYEPKLALDGGDDGLDYYRIIVNDSPAKLTNNGFLYLEIGHDQGRSVPQILKANFKNITVKKDYDNNDRMIKCVRR